MNTEERRKTLKNVLVTYLASKGMDVPHEEIQHTGSWNEGEFEVGNRIYQVDDLRFTQYGSDWYKCHEYMDYGNYRCSISYLFYGLTSEKRQLSIASEPVFTWNKRIPRYTKKTKAQLEQIVENYVREYVKKGCPGNADLFVLRDTIRYELGKLYLK